MHEAAGATADEVEVYRSQLAAFRRSAVHGAEAADPDGYYKSSVYSGAIHMLLDHTGHQMKGKWLGFNRDGGVSNGPCTLNLVSADTSKAAVEQYNRPVEPEPASS